MKKFTAVITAILIIAITVAPAQAHAEGYLETFNQKIEMLKEKFPHGKYWNHVGGPNNPDGVTDTPCPDHNKCDFYPDDCDCNSYSNAIQCHGFALKLGYDVFGTSPRDWTQKYGNDLTGIAPGDIIRYSSNAATGTRHSIFVIAVDGNTLTVAEANWGGRCRINWGRQVLIDDLLELGVIYTLHASNYDSVIPHLHSFTELIGTENAHPHRNIYKCECGETQVSDETNVVDDCDLCKLSIFEQKIEMLKVKFPHGKYWNHVGGTNNPDGVTDTPCPDHSNCGYYPDDCDCNSYLNAIQSLGFAFKLGYDVFGTSPRDWTRKDGNDLTGIAPGDIIRYSSNAETGTKHSLFVIAVDGGTLTVAEANTDGDCQISWGREVLIDDLLKLGVIYTLHATNYESILPHQHAFTELAGTESSHPHRNIYKCECGQTQVSEEANHVDTCVFCHTEYDFNEDGVVNDLDTQHLSKYLARWDIEINTQYLDINNDGAVDDTDTNVLAKLIANWDIELPWLVND